MKFLAFALSLFSFSALAGPITLEDYKWTVTDIASQGLNKEDLYKNMNRTMVRTGDSICSNRAQMWVNDFKRFQKIDSAKVFLFYTQRNSQYNRVSWWYHVTPAINENDQLWVMDAGFPNSIRKPLLVQDWLKHFGRGEPCKQIRAGENELIERIYNERVFPETTEYGTYGCYYIIAPHTYWTPGMLAMNLLGYDEERKPVNYSREVLDQGEVYQACLETSTTPFGYATRAGHGKCSAYLRQN